MMEALEKAKLRESMRYDKRILLSAVVASVADIKRVIADFDPNIDRDLGETRFESMVETDGKVQRVGAVTKSKTKRQMLLEGLRIIKARLDGCAEASALPISVNGREMAPAHLDADCSGVIWVDGLIKQWLGAKREGCDIYWDLADGRYKYDAFEHRLFRVKA